MTLFRNSFGFAVMCVAACSQAQAVVPSHMVFFDWGKVELTSDARLTLDQIASEFAASGKRTIVLQSHSDRSGPAVANLRKSQRRGHLVAAYLVAKGVRQDSIRVEALGETRPLVVTADGVREVQNRRVDVQFAD